jgi:hypothetical protein
MKSPFTGGKATIQKKIRTVVFRNEPIEILFQYYLCEDSGEQFTDEKLDKANFDQVYHQYKSKFGASVLNKSKFAHA